MRRLVLKVLFVAATGGVSWAAMAADHASADEAAAMVKKAAAYLKANGIEKTAVEVNNPKGQFIDRDLYVSIIDAKGINVAHGGNPKMVGKDLSDLRDADGVYINRQRTEILKTKPDGWINYKFVNPVTKQVEPKRAYFTRVDGYIISCGAYGQ
jgi:signal transduction histidine kinase